MADPAPAEEQKAADLHWRLRFLSPRSTALRIKLIDDYLRAARENALEEAAKWHDERAIVAESVLSTPGWESATTTMVMRQIYEAEPHKACAAYFRRSLKSPSSATTQVSAPERKDGV